MKLELGAEAIHNAIHTHMKTKDKLYELRQTIDDLVELGPDYAHFMNAQIAHKNLKKIKKLLEYIG